jgi:hypothetical protein
VHEEEKQASGTKVKVLFSIYITDLTLTPSYNHMPIPSSILPFLLPAVNFSKHPATMDTEKN